MKKFLVAFIATLALLISLFFWIGGDKPPQVESRETPGQVSESGSGTYLDYNGKSYQYWIGSEDEKGVNAAIFQPFLPKDDGVIVPAILELPAKTYGQSSLINPEPLIVDLNGVNHIAFRGDQVMYYALINKEDTGEVNGISYFFRSL